MLTDKRIADFLKNKKRNMLSVRSILTASAIETYEVLAENYK